MNMDLAGLHPYQNPLPSELGWTTRHSLLSSPKDIECEDVPIHIMEDSLGVHDDEVSPDQIGAIDTKPEHGFDLSRA